MMMLRSEYPESTMRMTPGCSSCTRLSNSAPSMTGMRMSATMMSNSLSSMRARASRPPGTKSMSQSPDL